MPSCGVERQAISGLLLRRAVIGILLAAGEPLTAREIAADLRLGGVTTNPLLSKGTSRVVADLLAYQARVGRVRKLGPATFVVLPGSMSRSTRWRCLRWRDEVARRRTLEDCLPPVMTSPSSPLSGASARGESTFEGGEPWRTITATPQRGEPSTVPRVAPSARYVAGPGRLRGTRRTCERASRR